MYQHHKWLFRHRRRYRHYHSKPIHCH